MNVSLTPELEAMIQEKVATGRYGSASEVVREALRLMEKHEQRQQDRLEELRREIQKGVDQIERGEYHTYDEEGLKQLVEDIKARGRKWMEIRNQSPQVQ